MPSYTKDLKYLQCDEVLYLCLSHSVDVNGTSEWHQQLLEDSNFDNKQMHANPLKQVEKTGSRIPKLVICYEIFQGWGT